MNAEPKTAQERLRAWGEVSYHQKRSVTIWSGPFSQFDIYRPGWACEASVEQAGTTIRVEANPLPDPETACQMVIDRLAEAGVKVD